ncbi:MAG: hypothetical protein GF313_10245, partial [Caldithrix sp.]|nr:hypothetical protein [Caldithrix sp.]
MDKQKNQITETIYRFGKRHRLLRLAGDSLRLLLILLLMWLSVALADDLFYFSKITRWGLLFLNLTLILLFLNRLALQPLKSYIRYRKQSDHSETAQQIGRLFPEINDQLLNVYHLIQHRETTGSTALRKAAIDTGYQTFSKFDFLSKITWKQFFPSIYTTILILFGSLTLLAFNFDQIGHSTLRLINPTGDYYKTPPYQFIVHPGNTSILRGDDVNISVDYSGPQLKSAELIIKTVRGEVKYLSLQKTGSLNQHRFTASIKDIRNNTNYKIKGLPSGNKSLQNKIWSKQYYIQTKIPPAVQDLDISLAPPAYTNLDEKRLDRNIGDIIALPGTRAHIQFSTNKPIKKALLKFKASDSVRMQIRGNQVDGRFNIMRDDQYHIQLTDTAGLNNQNPISYQIALMPDNKPFVRITEPDTDIESPIDAGIQIKAEASDDYGISSTQLVYKFIRNTESAADTNWKFIQLLSSNQHKLQVNIQHIWDFSEMPLTFGDGIKYYVRASDNNNITGPSIGRSAIQFIRFPSLEEIFEQTERQQSKQISEMDAIEKQSKDLEREVEELHRELKQNKNTNWEKKEQIKQAVKKQKEL